MVGAPHGDRVIRGDGAALDPRAGDRPGRTMKRVRLVQPSLQPPGGGNGVAAWVLQALVKHHQVTVLSWEPVDIAPINRFFGTDLDRKDFQTIAIPPTWRR